MVTTSVEVTSTRFERLNGIVFGLGTFTATMSQEAGGETQGEYVILAEDADEGVRVQRLMAFPARQAPEGPRSAWRSLSPAVGDTHTPLGEGNASCGAWVEARQDAGSDEATYSAWLSGYVTAYDRWQLEDYDATAVADLAGIRVWLDEFCRQNPLQAFSEAAAALVLELPKHRAGELPTKSDLAESGLAEKQSKSVPRPPKAIQDRLLPQQPLAGAMSRRVDPLP